MPRAAPGRAVVWGEVHWGGVSSLKSFRPSSASGGGAFHAPRARGWRHAQEGRWDMFECCFGNHAPKKKHFGKT